MISILSLSCFLPPSCKGLLLAHRSHLLGMRDAMDARLPMGMTIDWAK